MSGSISVPAAESWQTRTASWNIGRRSTRRGARPRPRRTSPIAPDGSSVFTGLRSPLHAARYHSLVIARPSLPDSLRITAVAGDDGEIMAVEHRVHPVVGVQFHPESAATEY